MERHEVEEVPRPGMEVPGEPEEEPVLEPAVLGVLVVGRVQVEDRRPGLRGHRAVEPERVGLEDAIVVPVSERLAEHPRALLLELAGDDPDAGRPAPGGALVVRPLEARRPEVPERRHRSPFARARVEEVGRSLGLGHRKIEAKLGSSRAGVGK